MPSPIRECQHKQAQHRHGTNAAYHLDNCRCRPCSKAAVAYDRNRTRQTAYGRWKPFVDATPSREHVQALRANGMGLKRIAAVSGVAHGTLWKLMYGRRQADGTQTPSLRVRPQTEAALLAVTAHLDSVSAVTLVDGTGTRRRLQGLVALGWSQSKLAALLNMERSNFGSILTRKRIHAGTARAVRDLYEHLHDQDPPEANHRDRIAASRARNIATARGWLTPGWWDDDTIDDPSYHPPVAAPTHWSDVDPVAVERAMLGDRVKLTRAERVAAAVQLRERGRSLKTIAKLLHVDPRQVTRDLDEHLAEAS